MTTLDGRACAAFLLCAFTIAGIAQTAWFASPWSRAFQQPIDGGATLRGHRVLGDHKTLRGFVVMVPATAAAFAMVSAMVGHDAGLWPLTASQYGTLGAWAGFGFMAGELPNSFVKRQLGVPAGLAARRPATRAVQFMADRLDSGIGMLAAMSLMVPVPVATWVWVLFAGLVIHWGFSVLMFRLGIKARAA